MKMRGEMVHIQLQQYHSLLMHKGTFVLLLYCFWNGLQNWNSKICLVTNER